MSSNKKQGHNKKWPYGIAIFYGFFVLALLGAWYFSTFHKPDLVTSNYYEKSIRYQEKIDQVENALRLESEPKLVYNKDEGRFYIELPASFAGKPVSGILRFFRPSDSKLDFSVELKVDNSLKQVVDLPGIYQGKWKLQFSWDDGENKYFLEKIIVV
ncbi:MAG TPA: hypothetical protein ENJ10_04230 [Caldithrix abyssi]|uniref:Nitrogen fixation protein FixH n=1 Tax=Caldithrix abyssi TaxID=187145 RepID=A0A7V1PUI5_CALAY|nr:hypothetical protein [Caldithrix abyssi]